MKVGLKQEIRILNKTFFNFSSIPKEKSDKKPTIQHDYFFNKLNMYVHLSITQMIKELSGNLIEWWNGCRGLYDFEELIGQSKEKVVHFCSNPC